MKPSPQKSRKRRLDREWEDVRNWVFFQRDRGKCVLHPTKPAVAVHHVFSKGAHPELRLDKKNLISLCADCHRDEANTKQFIQKCLKVLSKFGYDYAVIPFRAYVEEK